MRINDDTYADQENEFQIDFVVQNDAPYPMGDNPDIYKPIKDAGISITLSSNHLKSI